jgi:uncharacterized membrane protein YfcA
MALAFIVGMTSGAGIIWYGAHGGASVWVCLLFLASALCGAWFGAWVGGIAQ